MGFECYVLYYSFMFEKFVLFCSIEKKRFWRTLWMYSLHCRYPTEVTNINRETWFILSVPPVCVQFTPVRAKLWVCSALFLLMLTATFPRSGWSSGGSSPLSYHWWTDPDESPSAQSASTRGLEKEGDLERINTICKINANSTWMKVLTA